MDQSRYYELNDDPGYSTTAHVCLSRSSFNSCLCLRRVVILVTTALWAKLCLIGFKQRPVDGGPDQPMARFRRFLLLPVRVTIVCLCASCLLTICQISFRVILFICGFYWINSSSPRERQPNAPVMVLNHVGLFDALYFLVWDFPMVAVKVSAALRLILRSFVRANSLSLLLFCRMKLPAGPLSAGSYSRCSPFLSRATRVGRAPRLASPWLILSLTALAPVCFRRC